VLTDHFASRRAVVSLPLVCGVASCSGGDGATRTVCTSSARSAVVPALCAASSTVQGVDVSGYQGPVDWAAAKAAGIAFAFARVSDGTGYPDTEFATNWPALRAAGVVRGAYQFFRPAEDPAAQARIFLAMLSSAGGLRPGDLPPVIDVEVTDDTTDATIQAHMQAWVDAMQAGTGRQPIVYASPSFAWHLGTGFWSYPLWVASWGVSCPALPAGWSSWTFWQKSDVGTVQGIAGAVDLDEFDGSFGDLVGLAGASGRDASAAPPALEGGAAPSEGEVPSPGDAGANGEEGSKMGGGAAQSDEAGRPPAGPSPCGHW
jgi:lysozyme